MSQQPFQPPQTSSAKPFNRRLVAQGRVLPPAGGLRVAARQHFVTQERIGVCLAFAVLYGIVYGARLVFGNSGDGAQRGDVLTPLYVVAGVAAALWCLGRLSARRAAQRRVRRGG